MKRLYDENELIALIEAHAQGGGTKLYQHVSASDSLGIQLKVITVTATEYDSQTSLLNDIYAGHVSAAYYDASSDTGIVGLINILYGNLVYTYANNTGNIPTTGFFADGDTVTEL